jgi:hypothetical protein
LKLRLALLFTFALGLGIRLYDLTDPPFDFHATRQFRSAVIARGMYYARLEAIVGERREAAIQQWQDEQQLEPPLLEWLVSLTYHLPGGETLWKARLLSLCFWVLGGAALYRLIKELASPTSALISTLVYLFLPYGVIASRSFQPDPMMVGMTIMGVWRLYRWYKAPSWRNVLLAGTLAGMAILIKAVALFPLGGVAIALLFFDREWKTTLQDGQTWLYGLLALGPGAAYYSYGLFIAGFLRGQAAQSFLPNLWFTPNYYLRWAGLGVSTVGFLVLLIALAGVLFWPSKTGRALSIGWWAGYAAYGLAFPYHIMTHDYYQLPLIPLAAFSLAPAVFWVEQHLARYRIAQIVFGLVIGGMVAVQVWNARAELARKSYQSDAEEWGRYQTMIPSDHNVLALVQAYGYPLKYYGWTTATLWANTGDLALRELAGQSAEQLEQRRWSQFEGMDLFLVTNFNEFKRQPDLQEHLAKFGVFAEGEGYILYDLKNLRESLP